MSKQAIADFEAGLNKLCESYREKLTHAELVGTLDTVKMGYHIATIQSFEETVPALRGMSPSPKEIKDAKKKES
jgi:hypothetical protein